MIVAHIGDGDIKIKITSHIIARLTPPLMAPSAGKDPPGLRPLITPNKLVEQVIEVVECFATKTRFSAIHLRVVDESTH
jgi:hypothetical protein